MANFQIYVDDVKMSSVTSQSSFNAQIELIDLAKFFRDIIEISLNSNILIPFFVLELLLI